MHEEERMDALIDQALICYGEPGDPEALTERALAHVAREKAKSSRRAWKPWSLALAAAASLLVLFFTHPALRPILERKPETGRSTAGSLAGVVPRNAAYATHQQTGKRGAVEHRRQDAQLAALPKLNVFPTPHPLTPEEQALTAAAADTPAAQLRALAQAQDHGTALPVIAAVHMPPLSPPDEGQN